MRTWIGVHLPLLPLEAILPCWHESGSHAVLDRERVIALSRRAAAHGARLGMRRAGVQMLCPDARLHERDPLREREALHGIAVALLRYTPEVALAGEVGLLLDVTASLRAFGGQRPLCRRVRAGAVALGFTPRIGMAPTAQGAWLLAQRGAGMRRVIRMRSMARQLDTLSCALPSALQPHAEWLEGIGCRTLGELRRLPRAGLQRRIGAEALRELDRAYGEAPELFAWVQAPKTFSAKLELPDRVEQAQAVLFAARRLIVQMAGWLAAQQLAVSRFVLLLEHERGRSAMAPTPIEIALADPAWHEEHLTRLLKERLGRVTIGAPVIALRLETGPVAPMRPPSGTLFPEPGGAPGDYRRLLELLVARLGEKNVLAPAPRADHRPETANAWRPAGDAAQAPLPALPAGVRPFWLLRQPVALGMRGHHPFYGSPLRLVQGPERIESGWWDGGPIARDYFIAQSETSVLYWIYRERTGEDVRWFLQGLFG